MKADRARRQGAPKPADVAPEQAAVRLENTPTDLGRWQRGHDGLGGHQNGVPATRELASIRRRTGEREGEDLRLRIATPGRLLENGSSPERRILAAGGPGEISEGLDTLAGVDDVDPVADLEAPDQRQHLVRGQIEGMQNQAEIGMSDEGKEAI